METSDKILLAFGAGRLPLEAVAEKRGELDQHVANRLLVHAHRPQEPHLPPAPLAAPSPAPLARPGCPRAYTRASERTQRTLGAMLVARLSTRIDGLRYTIPPIATRSIPRSSRYVTMGSHASATSHASSCGRWRTTSASRRSSRPSDRRNATWQREGGREGKSALSMRASSGSVRIVGAREMTTPVHSGRTPANMSWCVSSRAYVFPDRFSSAEISTAPATWRRSLRLSASRAAASGLAVVTCPPPPPLPPGTGVAAPFAGPCWPYVSSDGGPSLPAAAGGSASRSTLPVGRRHLAPPDCCHSAMPDCCQQAPLGHCYHAPPGCCQLAAAPDGCHLALPGRVRQGSTPAAQSLAALFERNRAAEQRKAGVAPLNLLQILPVALLVLGGDVIVDIIATTAVTSTIAKWLREFSATQGEQRVCSRLVERG
eukprot:jgi/Mesen1/8479/ME000478S07974